MRTQGALTALVMLAVTLTGCTDTTPAPPPPTLGATTSPTPSPSPSPTPSPTPTGFDASVEPVAPPGLDGPPSKEAASEVAKYFLAHFPYIYATGDFSVWDEMSGDPCKFCKNARSKAHDIALANQHGVGGELEFRESFAEDYRPDEYVSVVRYLEHPSSTLNSQDEIVEDFPGVRYVQAEMLVAWRDGRWRIDSVTTDQLS